MFSTQNKRKNEGYNKWGSGKSNPLAIAKKPYKPLYQRDNNYKNNKQSNKNQPKYKDEYQDLDPEYLERLGFSRDLDLEEDDIDDGDDFEDVEVKPFQKKQLYPPEVEERRKQELELFKGDNHYDFEDFKFFDHPPNVKQFEEGDPLEFFITSSSWKYDPRDGTTLIFGGNLYGTSDSCTVHVTGFKPNFLIRNTLGWKEKDILAFMVTLEDVVRKQYKWPNWDKVTVDSIPKLFLNYETIKGKELREYREDVNYEYIKIHGSYPKAIAAARHILNSPKDYLWHFRENQFVVLEADIDFTQRFFYDTGLKPSTWIRVEQDCYDVVHKSWKSRTTRSVLEAKCRYQDLQYLKNPPYDTALPNWKTISYDIEVCNKPYIFPKPTTRPVIAIAMHIYRNNTPHLNKDVLFVYVKDGILPKKFDPKNYDHFYWYKSEPGLLKGFRDFILKFDPDFFMDYNGCNFDWTTIGDNAVMYFGKDYLVLGRDLHKKMRYGAGTKTEWRGKTKYTVEIDQRVEWDMLKVVPAIPLPGKFFFDNSLGCVAQELIGETKVEFDVNLTEQKWSNPETVEELWYYNKIDAQLPGKIAQKINSVFTFVSLSRATNVTLQKVINRGAGSKIEGYLRGLAMKKNIFFECIFKNTKTNRDLINKCAKQVQGACVIEPLTGYYRNYVFVLDFESMYPSIIRALNLCLMTHLTKDFNERFKLNLEDYWTIPTFGYDGKNIYLQANPFNPSFVTRKKLLGLLPEAQEDLGKWRTDVKAQLKEVEKQIEELKKKIEKGEGDKEENESLLFNLMIRKVVLDGTQQAIKIIMNGIFGQTIFEMSKFYMPDIGFVILQFGRYLLNYVKLYITNEFTNEKYEFTLEVIYGDTDSVMVHFKDCKKGKKMSDYKFEDFVAFAKIVTNMVNANFVNTQPLRMQLEKMYKRYLLITGKNYIGLIIKDMKDPNVCYIEEKGVKQKKKGTSKLAAKAGREVTRLAIEEDRIEDALEYIKDIIVKLKQRRVTMSDVIRVHNFGSDITVALYRYMVSQRQSETPPTKEVDDMLTKKYYDLDNSEREKNPSIVGPVVYAYREICKDPNKWFERGMTIHYIFREGVIKTKRELICPVADALSQDIPYNVEIYKEEIMKITKKIMGLIVGDKDVKNTPKFDNIINNSRKVGLQQTVDHVSFFERRFGPKTVRIKTDHTMCDNTIDWIVKNHKDANHDTSGKSLKKFGVVLYTKCAVCDTEMKDDSRQICLKCINNFGLHVKLEKELGQSRDTMEHSWQTCKNCLKSDKLNPLDCVAYNCNYISSRIDNTKDYYEKFILVKKLNESTKELF